MSIRFSFLSCFVTSALILSACGSEAPISDAPLSFAWPPTAGEVYPDVELLDMYGETVKLASFGDRVLLIEPIGMT